MRNVVVTGGFDDIRSREVRFLQEASRLGDLTVILWPDKEIERLTGNPPKFSQQERRYFLESLRYIQRVCLTPGRVELNELAFITDMDRDLWVVDAQEDHYEKRIFAASYGLGYQVIHEEDLRGWPESPDCVESATGERKKVIVTGCFDWLHSGHIRFFEEASAYGDLYVAVGHDENLRLLKGAGHPLFSQEERRYMVQSVKYVHQAIITSGQGWMDAEPEIALLQPDYYLVNEDGDKPEKRDFCARRQIEYVVLKRQPKNGLPRRESTALRGF